MRKGIRRYSGIFSTLLLVFVLLFCCSSAGYANYVLDPDFGSGGLVRTDFPLAVSESPHSLAIDNQGRLVAAGYSNNGDDDFALARYVENGDLDSSFGTGGIVSTDFGLDNKDYAYSLAIDSQDRLVAAGYSYSSATSYDFALARYKDNGELDKDNFGINGIVTTDFGLGNNDEAHSVAIDSQGRIVVAGRSSDGTDRDFALARYTSNGILDTTFGPDLSGKITTDFGSGDDQVYSLAIDGDGRLVVAGRSDNGTDYDFALARYKEDGDLDTTFGTGGIVTTDFGSGNDSAHSVAIDSQGRIVVAGRSSDGTDRDFALARYKEDGDLDTTFGTGGIVTTDFGLSNDDSAHSVAIDSQGRLIVAGHSSDGNDRDFALARYTSDGILDLSFGEKGKITTDFGPGYEDAASSLVIDDHGRLVVAGFSYNGNDVDFALARYKEIDKPVKKSPGGGGGCNAGALNPSLVLLLAPLLLLAGKR